MATTYVQYLYRAPGSSEEVEIRSEQWQKEPEDVLPLIDPVGATTTIRPDNREEYGEAREVLVLEYRRPFTTNTRWEDNPQMAGSNWVIVVVTDPDA